MIYKNIGPTDKTFYGVNFKPGDIKEVSGRIYHHKFIVMNSLPQEPIVDTAYNKSICSSQLNEKADKPLNSSTVQNTNTRNVKKKAVTKKLDPVLETNNIEVDNLSLESANASELDIKDVDFNLEEGNNDSN